MKSFTKLTLWLALFTITFQSSACKKTGIIPSSQDAPIQQQLTVDTVSNMVIFMDDIFPAIDGSLDCADALNDAIETARTTGHGILKIVGNPQSTYLFRKTINLSNLSGLTLDFNFATLVDDVQGNIPSSGNRANHTFQIYNSKAIRVERINMSTSSTRENNLSGPPTCIFWIGGQYLGGELTEDVTINDIEAIDGLPNTMFIAGVGELRGLSVNNIDLYGDYYYGINLEYGFAPSNPDTNPTMTNGRHPYNISVENFNGYNLINCLGFLRTAATYNVIFKNCMGYNVKNFIYAYCGDRDISRVSQNVKFINCKSKIDPSELPAINYGISIIVPDKDGSTGELLPSWTNYNQFFTFENCEIWNNSTGESACVRFFGTQGMAEFKNCIFKQSYYGVRGGRGATTNPTYISNFSLIFNNCVFTNNHRDVLLHEINGTTFNQCKFISQTTSSTLSQVHIGDNAPNTKFSHCFFESQNNNLYLTNTSTAINTSIEYCEFKTPSAANYCIQLSAMAIGKGNITNGKLIDNTSLTSKKITGESSTELRNMDSAGTIYDFSVVTNAIISTELTGRTLSQITNGEVGDTFTLTGVSNDANITIINNDAGVPTEQRLLTITGSNVNLSGRQHLSFLRTSSGWIQQ